MDVIKAARQLGKAIQAEDSFIKMMAIQQVNDEDENLQDMIKKFNLKRQEINNELQKEDKNSEEVSKLDQEMKEIYNTIFENPNMTAFTAAHAEIETMLDSINQIITGSTQGLDPDTIELQEKCGGECGGCSGCH